MNVKEYDLETGIIRLQHTVEKLKYIIQELTENYFDKYDNKKQEDKWAIIYDYKRYRAFADIVNDYVYDVRKIAEEISDVFYGNPTTI